MQNTCILSNIFQGKNLANIEAFVITKPDGALLNTFPFLVTKVQDMVEALNQTFGDGVKKADIVLMNRFVKGAYQETGFGLPLPIGYLFMPIGESSLFFYRNDVGSHFSPARAPFRVFAKKSEKTLIFLICQRKGNALVATGEISHPIIFDEDAEKIVAIAPTLLAEALKEYRSL